MLNDIRLTPGQADLLAHAARQAGGELIPEHRGSFAPAGPVCIGLRAPTSGVLMRFGAMVGIALDLPDPLLGQMAARLVEEPWLGRGQHVYYWPGITCPEPARAGPAEQELPGLWSRSDTDGGWTETGS